MNPRYFLMILFYDFHVLDGNILKIGNLLIIPKHWQKFVKITVLILLKYCSTIVERNEFCFQV